MIYNYSQSDAWNCICQTSSDGLLDKIYRYHVRLYLELTIIVIIVIIS